MTNDEFNVLLMKMDQDDRTKLLTEMGGLRGLFDTLSHEFKQTEVGQKLLMLASLCQAGDVVIETLEEPFVETMHSSGYTRSDAREQFKSGLCTLLTHAICSAKKRKKVAK